MNLADAIRQAAQINQMPLPTNPHPDLQVLEAPVTTVPLPLAGHAAAWPTVPISNSGAETESAGFTTPSPVGNVVRLELFLSPEQLSGLFRAVVANQHSVMTLREAAAYLRLPAQSVEQMAMDNTIPALLIDGKWRFTHAAIDEWLGLQQIQGAIPARTTSPRVEKGA